MKENKFSAIFLGTMALITLWVISTFVILATSQKKYGRDLIQYSENAHKTEKKIEAWRGKILDRNGNELAATRRSYDMSIQLKMYKADVKEHRNWILPNEINKIADVVSKVTKYDRDDLVKKLKNKNVYQVEIGKDGKNLSTDQKNEIEKLKNPGIHFTETTSRYYSDPYLGSMLLGYTSKDKENNIKGMNGIEKFEDKNLSGKEGKEIYITDKNGYKLPHTSTQIEKGVNPKDIKLTIDQHIQSVIEKEIKKGQEDNKAEWVTGVVTDAQSGEVLGAAASPGFNMETLEDIKLFNSPLANEQFEPGSVMKVFTWANAMDKNRYNPNQEYKSGEVKIGPHTIRDHTAGGWGMTTFDEAFYRSSNTGAIYITRGSGNSNEDGYNNMLSFFKKLGFGTKTGIEISDEQPGYLPKFTTESEVATATFGQNMMATPFQLLRGLSAISSNDHNVYNPRVVKEIIDSKTNKVQYKYNKSKNILIKNAVNDKTAKKMLELLRGNVSGSDKFKTGTNFKIDGYEVGVKTGSAQIADEISKYSTSDNLMLLSGLSVAPVDNPKINVYIAMKRPKSGGWNVPSIYKPIVQDVLSYLGTVKKSSNGLNEDVKEVKEINLPSLVNMTRDEAEEFLKQYGFKHLILGNGKTVKEQFPNNNDKIMTNETIILKTDDKILMPDMKGMSQRDVSNICSLLNIKVKFKGSGYVQEQSIKPNQEVKKNQRLDIELK